MTRNPDANIARTAEAWRVDFHNAEAWEVVVSVVPEDRCHDGAADITTDEARAIRDAMTARGLVCVCDAALVYGDA